MTAEIRIARSTHMSLKRAAYHEAGHAVARAALGKPSIRVEISDDGHGMTHGTNQEGELRGQYAVWDEIVYGLAGSYAEARAAKVSTASVLLTHGYQDWQQIQPAIDWLINNGYAESNRAAHLRAEAHTCELIRERWAGIECIAAALLEHRSLNGEQIDNLLKMDSATGARSSVARSK